MLNVLVSETRRERGAVRTPPPDPTFSDSVVAYYLLFPDPASATRAEERGDAAVLEFRDRFNDSGRSETGYDMTEVRGNLLVLYLEDPAGAQAQRDAINDCVLRASG